jgi:hypothetical protein
MMLNVCGVVRPIIIVVAMVAMLSIVAPGFFATIWPYLAAAGVLVVPALVWQLWNTRYNPGCSVRFPSPSMDEDRAETR